MLIVDYVCVYLVVCFFLLCAGMGLFGYLFCEFDWLVLIWLLVISLCCLYLLICLLCVLGWIWFDLDIAYLTLLFSVLNLLLCLVVVLICGVYLFGYGFVCLLFVNVVCFRLFSVIVDLCVYLFLNVLVIRCKFCF